MSAQHTPGPWCIDDFEQVGLHVAMHPQKTTAIRAGTKAGRLIAFLHQSDEANARLIAAAPDLLAALKDLLDDIDEYVGNKFWIDRARAAIAKATSTPTE